MNEGESEGGGLGQDPKAFEALYHELAPKLVSYLVANGSDYATAGDIAQETFLRLWKRRDELVEDAGQISGLAFTVAKNLRTDGWLKARHETLSDEVPETPVAPAASPGDEVERRGGQRCVTYSFVMRKRGRDGDRL